MEWVAIFGAKKLLILLVGVGCFVAAMELPFWAAAILGLRAATIAGVQSWRRSKLCTLKGLCVGKAYTLTKEGEHNIKR